MDLPVMPPVAPMLAKPVGELPEGPWSFEPKWDGFRTIVFRDGDEVELGSRKERPDDPLLPRGGRGRPGQPAAPLCGRRRDRRPRRRRPAARLRRPAAAHPPRGQPGPALLATQTPARLVAFDLLALDETDYMGEPFARRRAALEQALGGVRAPVHLTPATTDRHLAAEWLGRFEGAGLDGLVAKALDGTYEPDRRAWRKVKHTRTADCVVAGYRLHKRGDRTWSGRCCWGCTPTTGELAMAGVIGAFPMERRRELFAELQPLVTSFEGHPWDWGAWQREAEAAGRAWRGSNTSRWNPGKELSFTPLRPERVVEVRYDHLEGRRFRHTAQFLRWRPDRDPRSCTYDQLEETVSYDLAEVLATPAT